MSISLSTLELLGCVLKRLCLWIANLTLFQAGTFSILFLSVILQPSKTRKYLHFAELILFECIRNF